MSDFAHHYGMPFDAICWDCDPTDHPYTAFAPGICRFCCYTAKEHYENYDSAMKQLRDLERDLRDDEG